MKDIIKKIMNWFELNLPIIWGMLWVIAITCGSLALVLWTIKLLLGVIGLI